jgi:hypothetical protein
MLVGEAIDAVQCFEATNLFEKLFIVFAMMIG